MKVSEVFERFENKKKASEDDLSVYQKIGEDRFGFISGDTIVPLDAFNEKDELDNEEIELAIAKPPEWDTEKDQSLCGDLPDSVDHRSFQSPIKNQLDRGTCVCFASLACLEAISNRKNLPLNLSEQFANWSYMRFEGRDHCDDGLKTTSSAKYLKLQGVCLESNLAYQNRAQVRMKCDYQPSQTIMNNAIYGIKDYSIIDNIGFNGPSIANTDYLECLLSKGYDIVIGTKVAWGRNPDSNGVFDLLLDRFGNPLKARGGHAMLLVGYDKSAPEPYFIFKNSWGPSDGVGGYRYLSYDYVRYYIKYGYIVLDANL